MRNVRLPKVAIVSPALLTVVAGFVLVGTVLFLLSSAATGTNRAIEAESVTPAGKASITSAAGASNGSFVTLNAAASSSIYKGVAIGPYVPYSNEPDEHNDGTYELLAESGVHALRIGLPWREMQPDAKGVWDANLIAQADIFINKVTAMNIKLLVVVVGSPAWASGGGGFNSPNFKDSDYADYLEQILRRYPGKIEAIEVWNEPAYSGFLETSDPGRYTSMLKAAYTRIKQVDPSVIVVGGSLYGSVYNNPDFLRGMYQNGAKDYFDVLGQHQYGDTPARASFWGSSAPPAPYAVLLDSIKNNIVSIMQEYGDGAKPIWMTETGANTATGGNGVTEQQQAAVMSEVFGYLKSGYIPTMQRIYWYNWSDGWTQGAEANQSNPEWKYGIVTPRGGPFPVPSDWYKKPAFEVFKNL